MQDTAREVRLVPREPTHKEFVPIGHVALDVHSAEEDAKLGLPSEGVVWIHQLYVSYALQRGGFGAAAMDLIEAVAAQAPLNGKMTVLDTIATESQINSAAVKGQYEDLGIPAPTVGGSILLWRGMWLMNDDFSYQPKSGMLVEGTRYFIGKRTAMNGRMDNRVSILISYS